jgi:hypothetical protein
VILEGLVTTLSKDGDLNVAPMGPTFETDWSRFVLRPFRTSTTYRNLESQREGVLHVTDDVLLLARAAIGVVTDVPTRPAEAIRGRVILSSARYHEFKVITLDASTERTTIVAETVASGHLRELFGLNRAKHAVVEAAILATRLSILPIEQILEDFRRLAPLVEKTGGPDEQFAFAMLKTYVESSGAKS